VPWISTRLLVYCRSAVSSPPISAKFLPPPEALGDALLPVDVPVLDVPVLDVPVLDVPVLDVPVLDVPAAEELPMPLLDPPETMALVRKNSLIELLPLVPVAELGAPDVPVAVLPEPLPLRLAANCAAGTRHPVTVTVCCDDDDDDELVGGC
jgi:hypothetical protein